MKTVRNPRPRTLLHLLRTPAVWAIIVCHFCANWRSYVLLAWMPTYINKGLSVDFASVSIFTMIPSLFAFLALVGYVESIPLAIAMMSLGSLFGGAATGGFGVNHLDIAPRGAGMIMGLSTGGDTPRYRRCVPQWLKSWKRRGPGRWSSRQRLEFIGSVCCSICRLRARESC